MADQSVRTYLKELEEKGELSVFNKEIDPDVNMSAVAWKNYAQRGKASLFKNITGHAGWRAIGQIVADRRKWAVALGVDEEKVVSALVRRMNSPKAAVEVEATSAPCKENKFLGAAVDLSCLPAMWTSELDPGRYIASGICIIKNPTTGVRNVSYHRAQIIGRNRTGYLMLPRQAARIASMYREIGKPMEVAMVIGTHPLIAFAGAFVAPFGVDELTIAGGLLQEPVRVVKCESVDIEVPAESEIVLEGTVSLDDTSPEGPFGEVTGTYGHGGDIPVFNVKAMTHRNDPIFYAMLCGLPPSDTHSIVSATIEMKLWQHLQNNDAGRLNLLDVRCLGGVSPLLVVVQVKSGIPGQARAAAIAALSSPYLHPKFAIAVDEDIDPSSIEDVLWAVATRVDASKDILRFESTRVFGLDTPSYAEEGVSGGSRIGTKMVIDATKLAGGLFEKAVSTGETKSPGQSKSAPQTTREEWGKALGLGESELLATLVTRLANKSVQPAKSDSKLSLKVDKVDLQSLRFLHGAEHDKFPVISCVLFVKDTARRLTKIASVQVQISGSDQCTLFDLPPHCVQLLEDGNVETALVFGADRSVHLAAEFGFLWSGCGVELASIISGSAIFCAEVEQLKIPAEADYIVSGQILTNSQPELAKVSNQLGTYSVPQNAFTMQCRSMYRRAKTDTHAVKSNEAARLLATEVLILMHVQNIEGGLDILDVRCHPAARGLIAVIKLRPRLQGQAKTALLGAISGLAKNIKCAIAVDEDVDASSLYDVLWSLASRTHAGTDIGIAEGLPASASDHTASVVEGAGGARVGARWFVDTTMPPLSQMEAREKYFRALPKNFDKVRLQDFE